MKLLNRTPATARPGLIARRLGRRPVSPCAQAGLLLGECLIYIAVWSVLLGLAFATFYRVLDNATKLRRSAADITRALHAGERWREDIRQATGSIQLEGVEGAVEQALHVPQTSGEVIYFFTGTNVLRRTRPDAPWLEALGGVKTSRMIRDVRERVVAWRWELELKTTAKKIDLRPLFSVQAVATDATKP
jgi:hypothetical protein